MLRTVSAAFSSPRLLVAASPERHAVKGMVLQQRGWSSLKQSGSFKKLSPPRLN